MICRDRVEAGKKLAKLLIPSKDKYSAMLKGFPSEFLAFVSDQKSKLEYN